MTELDKKIENILNRDLYLKKDFERSKSDIKQLIKEAKEEALTIPHVVNRRELLFAFINEVKEEFKDENLDYLDFIADRVLSK
jgi:hypothetical protein